MTTYDVAAFQPPSVSGGQYTAGIYAADNSGRLITGTEKIVQRFLLELMTEVGSMPFMATRGCEFIYLLKRGFMSEADAIAAFDRSIATIRSNMQTDEDSDTDESNEVFDTATLVSIALAKTGTATLKIQLYATDSSTGILSYPLNIVLNTQTIATLD